MTQLSKGFRRGSNFTVRVTDEERARLDALRALDDGPRNLGPWLVWKAQRGPEQLGLALSSGNAGSSAGVAVPGRGAEAVPCQVTADFAAPPPSARVILDLCGGSGSWSAPYREAGYDVRLITLPENDVRLFVPPPNVWGVLAAPPCTEFSMAKNGFPRDFVRGMECVNACMRIVLQCRPKWWALENPTGHLSKWLGTPRDVWQPCDFGDPHTKRTAIWGEYALPRRRYVLPVSGMPGKNAAERAVTPSGFARAFFDVNP